VAEKVACVRNRRNACREIWVGKPEVKDKQKDLDVCGWITLRWILGR
jgi:hypothetical protein